MRSFFLAACVATLLFSCKKDNDSDAPGAPLPPPVERDGIFYLDLQDFSVTENSRKRLDLDGDGVWDFSFSTLRIGDPLNNEDRTEFFVGSNQHAYLMFNSTENVPAFTSGQEIPLGNTDGWNWFEIGYSVLIAKIIRTTPPVLWDGSWKTTQNRFIPVQLRRAAGIYCGWIEVSADTAGSRVILHRVAISRVANKTIKAGE